MWCIPWLGNLSFQKWCDFFLPRWPNFGPLVAKKWPQLVVCGHYQEYWSLNPLHTWYIHQLFDKSSKITVFNFWSRPNFNALVGKKWPKLVVYDISALIAHLVALSAVGLWQLRGDAAIILDPKIYFLNTFPGLYIPSDMPSRVWNEISNPLPNFNRSTIKVWEWKCNSTAHIIIIMDVITHEGSPLFQLCRPQMAGPTQ